MLTSRKEGVCSPKIAVSNRLIDYYLELYHIQEDVAEAYSIVTECAELIRNKVYEGKAKDELEYYFSTLSFHIYKINLLYSGATKYVINVLNSFNEIDLEATSEITNKGKN